MLLRAAVCQRDAVRGVVGRDDERDRAEQLLHDLALVAGIDLQHQRRADARAGELRVLQHAAVGDDLAQCARRFDALHHPVVLDRAQQLHRLGRIAGEPDHALPDRRGHLVEAEVPFRRVDAVLRHIDVLRCRAHLARVQRQRERDIAHHALEVAGGVDHDLVDAGLLGIDLGLVRIALQPVAIGAAAGEVDQAHFRAQRQRGRHALGRVVGHQRDQVGVEAGFLQHLARHLDGDRQRQDRARVRLDHHRIAGRQAGEQAGIAVPGREGAAADHQAHAARHHAVALFHAQRFVLALRLFPRGLLRNAAQFVPGIGHGFQAAVLRVRAAGLEGHHEGLAGGVHHRVGNLEAAAVQALQDFQRHADPGFRPGLAPGRHAFGHAGKELVEVGLRIGDAQFRAVGRDFLAGLADGARLRQRERAVQAGLKGGLAIGAGRFAVDPGARHFGERAPVAALGNGLGGLFQQRLVAFKKQMGHGLLRGQNSLCMGRDSSRKRLRFPGRSRSPACR
ncbi:hypothetical protein D9M72_345530 [compost metagenome]